MLVAQVVICAIFIASRALHTNDFSALDTLSLSIAAHKKYSVPGYTRSIKWE